MPVRRVDVVERQPHLVRVTMKPELPIGNGSHDHAAELGSKQLALAVDAGGQIEHAHRLGSFILRDARETMQQADRAAAQHRPQR